jgi:hypothetical protein
VVSRKHFDSNIDRYYDSLDVDRRRWFFETVTAQIHALLGLEIDPPRSFRDQYSTFVDDLSERLNVRLEEKCDCFPRDSVMSLIRRLASDREQPVPSFIRDVCEIQFLSREDRSEYTCHQQSGKPFKINKILLEYAIKSSQIDDIMGRVTKRYCAESCDRLPTGCCHILGYDLGLVPETMLELQRLEARKNGWEAIADGVERQCRFHSAGGCTIAASKSPSCVGYLCDQLASHLEDTYPAVVLEPFLEALARFRNCCIDRSEVFETMDAIIRTGMTLGCWQQRGSLHGED